MEFNNIDDLDIFGNDKYSLKHCKSDLTKAYWQAKLKIDLEVNKIVYFDGICCEYDESNGFDGCCENCPLWPDPDYCKCGCLSPDSFFKKYKLAVEQRRFKAAEIHLTGLYKQILQIKIPME